MRRYHANQCLSYPLISGSHRCSLLDPQRGGHRHVQPLATPWMLQRHHPKSSNPIALKQHFGRWFQSINKHALSNPNSNKCR